MATVNFSVRMDADLKREVEAIYAELGMNLTSAVNASYVRACGWVECPSICV